MSFDLEVCSMGGEPLAVVQGVNSDWTICEFKEELQAQISEDKKGLPVKLMHNGHVFGDAETLAAIQDSSLIAVFESRGFEHLENLESSDSRKRCVAAEALGKLGSSAAPHAACLAPLLHDKYGHVRSAASTALKNMGATGGRYVITLLQSNDPQEQCAGAEALVVMGVQSEYVADIAELLQSANQQVRSCAVKVLASMGVSAASHVTKLVSLLRNSKFLTRECIPQAIAHIGEPAIPHVASLLSHPDANIRSHAAQILGRMGPSAAQHAIDLEALLEDPENHVQCSAIHALVTMNVLQPLLHHSTMFVRCRSINALQPQHSENVVQLLSDPDERIRLCAAEAFKRLDIPALPHCVVLSTLLEDPNSSMRLFAAEAFGSMGVLASRYKSKLAALLRSSEASLRQCAAKAIASAIAEERRQSNERPGCSNGRATSVTSLRHQENQCARLQELLDTMKTMADVFDAEDCAKVQAQIAVRTERLSALRTKAREEEQQRKEKELLFRSMYTAIDAPAKLPVSPPPLGPPDQKSSSQGKMGDASFSQLVLPPMPHKAPKRLLASGALEAKLWHKSATKELVPGVVAQSTRRTKLSGSGSCPAGMRGRVAWVQPKSVAAV